LQSALAKGGDQETLEAVRALIDKVIIFPPEIDRDPPGVELIGELMAMLTAAGATPPAARSNAGQGGDPLAVFVSSVMRGQGQSPWPSLPWLQPQSRLAPYVMILMRHGQSEFNLHFSATKRDPGIHDPRLTPLGHQQAEAAAEALRGAGITRILASPYTRALQTAAPTARALGLPVQVHPGVRERYHFTCDIGSRREVLAAAWPDHDFTHLDEVWWPEASETPESVVERARLFREEMHADGDWAHTLVVSHWAFLLTLTGHSLENGAWIRFDPREMAVQPD
jgi:broad specificity phosphatase PhoE